jgi:hypothetical protein
MEAVLGEPPLPNRTLKQTEAGEMLEHSADTAKEWSAHDQMMWEIRDAVAQGIKHGIPPLSEDEITWVRLAIAREVKRAARWEAIMTHTLKGLAWMALLALGGAVWNYIKEHLK